MKVKKLVTRMAIGLLIGVFATPLTAHADFTQTAVVNGDGVRLRKRPAKGDILELMYTGETITIDDRIYNPKYPAWLYVRREKTGTKGWIEWSYFVHE